MRHAARWSPRTIPVLAAAALVLGAACASPAPPADRAAIAKTLTDLDAAWSAAAGARNVDGVASFYAQDAVAYPPGAPTAVGFAAAKAVWAGYFADSTFTISWTTTSAGASESGDLGYTAGTYTDSYKGPDGNLVNETGKYFCLWQKQADGSWKAVHDIWNTDS